MENKEILEILKPYFISQYVEKVLEDECPIWHTNEYHVAGDKICELLIALHKDESWNEMIEYGVNHANVERRFLESIPLHI